MTLFDALTATAARNGHSPAVVFRDVATGERTELSWATLHNWVSKMANLLVEEFDAGLGTQVGLRLPLHWMDPVVCFATWAIGGAVTTEGVGEVTIAHEADGPDAPDGADLLIGAGMAGRLLEVEAKGALTITDVLAQPDDFLDDPGDDGAWAIGGRTHATLLAEPLMSDEGRAALIAGDRLTDEVVFLFARALPAGTPLVLARGYDAAGLASIATQERAG